MLTAILFDDEKPALRMLEIQIGHVGGVTVIGKYTEYKDLVAAISIHKPDIAFLDIETPTKNGMEAAGEILKISPETDIIFVTAYKDYAYNAFELEAQDYLLKPVKKKRLERTLSKLKNLKNRQIVTHNRQDIYGTSKLIVHCFGKFEVKDRFGNDITFRTKKTKELMAFLIHNHDRTMSAEVIIEALWPDKTLEKAKGLLYTTMYYLKKTLSEYGIDSIQKDYLMQENDFQADFITFLSIYTVLDGTGLLSSWNERQIEAFIKLDEIYSGKYFEEDGYDWANAFFVNYENKYNIVAYKAIEYFEKTNRIHAEIELLEKLILKNEYQEQPYKKLLTVYEKLGNLKEYERIEKRFKTVCKEMEDL